MFGSSFYHGSIRKYVTLFGTLFNDISIGRLDEDGVEYQVLQIPISYGPKEKVLARLNQDPGLDRKYAISLPRMAFEMTNMNYAPERKLLTINRSRAVNTSDASTLKYQYNPVPYDIMFSLYIMTKNAEDGARIVEQILPFFTPEWTASVNMVPEMNIMMDIPIILLDVVTQDIYEANFEERRTLMYTINFIMKGYIFGPVKKSAIINLANTNFFDTLTSNTLLESTSVEPGLMANGSPTANASLSVGADSIQANSNFGYVITKTSS